MIWIVLAAYLYVAGAVCLIEQELSDLKRMNPLARTAMLAALLCWPFMAPFCLVSLIKRINE